VWDVLKTNIYLDAVVYGEVGLRAAVQASGADRLMFGTDHPFFPPLEEGEKEWLSVRTNERAVEGAFGGEEEGVSAVMGGNAVRVLKLDVRE
jgi:aminocarboxymuconate-semialdehyde decarboxylase